MWSDLVAVAAIAHLQFSGRVWGYVRQDDLQISIERDIESPFSQGSLHNALQLSYSPAKEIKVKTPRKPRISTPPHSRLALTSTKKP